jgi:hypothetical protein
VSIQNHNNLTTSAWFVIPALLLLFTLSANIQEDWVDGCLLAYAVNAMLALCCGCVYLWWWRKTGMATDVYQWVTMLFFSITWNKCCAIYARYLYLQGDMAAYRLYMDGTIWNTRTIPESIVLLYMIVLVADRIRKS